jgi:hypothetical protein
MNVMRAAPDRFRPAPTVRRMRAGGRGLLFCERRQQLFELNAAAEIIWDALLEESPSQAARRLSGQFGGNAEEAHSHVWGQLRQWLREGYWEPAEPSTPARAATLRLSIESVRVEIGCGDEAILSRLQTVFGQFPAFPGAPTVRITITPWSGGFHLFDGARYGGALASNEVAPRIKAILTERVVGRRFDGFFAHGALVARGPILAMLAGPPGAGKSTLALALQAAGWSLCADDLIRVDRSARFRGVPFAPAIKEGAWTPLQDKRPELAHWPVELRSDGQRVRYAPVARAAPRSRPLRLFIALSRQAGAAAQAATIDPVEALSLLLGEAFSARGRISAELMARLVERFRQTPCRRLVYDRLDDGVAAVEALCREL